ncbi:MAG: flagellar FlbD family protein [Cellulosilyticaceae bacterium]
MIQLTKINGMTFTLNLDLIETLEEVPDTVITTTTGNKYIVKESIQEIKQQAIDYKQKIIMV